ncbi:MAG: repair protein RecN [Bacteroidota bacterium]|jgi:DNA repair protein RecN (Recombination protein N)
MLQQLYIRNYALIREIRLDLSEGFTVMTGETGAGKSILLGALGLILGERADSTVLRDPNEKCVVEGHFIEPALSHHPLALELDLQGETDWCLRREVSSNGKSRAFLNDTPVTLNQLQSFASGLVDLHQQFDTLELTASDRQRELLDVMAGHVPAVASYQLLYAEWRSLMQQLQQLETEQTRRQQEKEYDQHLLEELEEIALLPDELEGLEEKVRLSGQSEGLTQALATLVENLQGEGENMSVQLRRAIQALTPHEKNQATIQQWLERIRTIDLELRELAREMDRFGAQLHFDPRELSIMQERLSMGFRLLKKHGKKNTQELIELQKELSKKLESMHDLDGQIQDKKDRCTQLETTLRQLADSLHASRAAVVGPWTEQVNALLTQVGMPTARFGVSIQQTDLGPHGTDECTFLLDANYHMGQTAPNWQPVKKVASGGELSRLMLCIKSLAANRMELPTMIFDEIDAGISGEAAKQVGLLLRALGNHRQVICVTHQPQVAAKGQHHFHVVKSETSTGIETRVTLLSRPQRVEALARIIGGESPTETALQNAHELLSS